MASLAARAQRNGLVRQSLEQVLERLAKRLDIEIPPEAARSRDPDLQPILELERFRDTLVAIDEALDQLQEEGEAPAGKETWTQKMLRDYAKEHDIHIPGDVRKNAEIAAFIDQYEADQQAAAEAEDVDGQDEPPAEPVDPREPLGEPADMPDEHAAGADEDTRANGPDTAPRFAPADAGASELNELGTVRVGADGEQTVVEPREGSDQQPGDPVGKTPANADRLSDSTHSEADE